MTVREALAVLFLLAGPLVVLVAAALAGPLAILALFGVLLGGAGFWLALLPEPDGDGS